MFLSTLADVRPANHRYCDQVDTQVAKSLVLITADLSNLAQWEMVHENGDMKVYRTEFEENGIACDRLRANHSVAGVL